MGDARWDAVANDFIGHYENLYGQVRIHVLHAHLMDHLPPPPAAIIDIGGGAGNQSIGLARAGFNLTIVDPSSVMLEEADRLLASEPPDVGARVRLVEAGGERAPELFGDAEFDGVLCHGVLMYLDDPAPLVTALCGLVRPHGIVSIVTKNRRTLAAGPAYQGDWRTALLSFDGERQVNRLGIDTRADDLDDLSDRLRDRGVEPIAWYGVRTFTEGWARDRPPVDPVDDVLAVELEASRRDPYRRMSRLFHLVGRRDRGAPA